MFSLSSSVVASGFPLLPCSHTLFGFSHCWQNKYQFSRFIIVFIVFVMMCVNISQPTLALLSVVVFYHLNVGVSDSWLHNHQIKRLHKLHHIDTLNWISILDEQKCLFCLVGGVCRFQGSHTHKTTWSELNPWKHTAASLNTSLFCWSDPSEISTTLIYLCLLSIRNSVNGILLIGCLAKQNAARLQWWQGVSKIDSVELNDQYWVLYFKVCHFSLLFFHKVRYWGLLNHLLL